MLRENHRVVRFEVETKSISHEDMKFSNEGTCSFNDNARPQYINRKGMTKLFFTYSVEWKQSDVRWASRWDSYLAMSDVQIHWFSIVNSVIVVFFLSGILTMIIIRTLRRDIAKYFPNNSKRLKYFLIIFRQQVQSGRRWRRNDWRIWMETCSRRCFPSTKISQTFCRCYWKWNSDILHGSHHSLYTRLSCDYSVSLLSIFLFIFSFCHAGNALARIQRRPYDSRYFSVCLHGADCRLPLGPTLQDHERKGVEEGRLPCMFVNLYHRLEYDWSTPFFS